MSNYSEFFNNHVYTINNKAVNLGSGEAFVSENEASITQKTFLNATQSGVNEATHIEDPDYTRFVQVLEKIPGSTGVTNTTLDFDVVDENNFIQEDSVSGTDFVGGIVKLHETPTLGPTTSGYFDPDTADGTLSFYNNNKTVTGAAWHAVKSRAETGVGESTYFEYYLDEFSGDLFMLGVIPSSNMPSTYGAGGIFLYSNGRIRYGAAYYDLTGGTPIASYTTGDIIGVVVEDGYRMHFYKGNDYMGYYDGPSDTWSPCVSLYGPMTVSCRLVQDDTTLSAKQGATDGFLETISTYQYSSSVLTKEEAENDSTITDFGTITIESESNGINTMPAINITDDTSYMIVETSPSILLGSGDFTIEFDVNLTTHGYVISNNYGDANSWFVMTSTSYIRFYSYHGSTYVDWTDAEAILSYGTDYNVALVRSGTNFDLYVDGNKVGTTKTLSDTFNTSTSTLGIGARRDGSLPTFIGKLNNVEISNSARYTSNFTPSTEVHETQSDTLFLLRVKRYITDNSKYITTSDDNHIDLSDFDVINSCSVTNTVPTNTDVTTLISFDGRTTWKKADIGFTSYVFDSDVANSDSHLTLSNGNKTVNITNTYNIITNTGLSSGKWYWEVVCDASTAFSGMIGVAPEGGGISAYPGSSTVGGYGMYSNDGYLYDSGSTSSYGTSYNVGSIIGVALDLDNNTIQFFEDGSGYDIKNITGSITYYPSIGTANSSADVNFTLKTSSDEISYSAPSGFGLLGDYFSNGFVTYSGGLADKTSWNTLDELSIGLTDLTVTSEMSYLDFAFNLNTDDTTVTPEVDLITLNYDESGYYATALEEDYDVDFFSATVTKVTKLSSGTVGSIKVNIAL